jgi:hypothetical protein
MDWLGLATSAGAVVGIDPGELLTSAWEGLLNALGLNDCSGANKARYRLLIDTRVRDMEAGGARARTAEGEVRGWIDRGRIGGATGNCNRYAFSYLARRMAELHEAQQEQAAETGDGGASVWAQMLARVRRQRAVADDFRAWLALGHRSAAEAEGWVRMRLEREPDTFDNKLMGLLDAAFRAQPHRGGQQQQQAAKSGGGGLGLLLALGAAALAMRGRR